MGENNIYKQVIHFYQGQKAQFVIDDKGNSCVEVINLVSQMPDGSIEVWGSECECVPTEKVALLLRRINSITEDEKTEFKLQFKGTIAYGKYPSIWVNNALAFLWHIRKGFDIFDLIDEGYAIDIDNGKYDYTALPDINFGDRKIRTYPKRIKKEAEFAEREERIKRIAAEIESKL